VLSRDLLTSPTHHLLFSSLAFSMRRGPFPDGHPRPRPPCCRPIRPAATPPPPPPAAARAPSHRIPHHTDAPAGFRGAPRHHRPTESGEIIVEFFPRLSVTNNRNETKGTHECFCRIEFLGLTAIQTSVCLISRNVNGIYRSYGMMQRVCTCIGFYLSFFMDWVRVRVTITNRCDANQDHTTVSVW